MAKAAHCDADGCVSHSYSPRKHFFLTVKGKLLGTKHYCSVGCVLKDLITMEPDTEVILPWL